MGKRVFIVHYDILEAQQIDASVFVIAVNVVDAKQQARLAIREKHNLDAKFKIKIKNVNVYKNDR